MGTADLAELRTLARRAHAANARALKSFDQYRRHAHEAEVAMDAAVKAAAAVLRQTPPPRSAPPRASSARAAEDRAAPPERALKLHSIPETAELLGGCSKMHVYRLIAAGELRAVDIAAPGAGRAKTRIRSDDLADYIDRHARG